MSESTPEESKNDEGDDVKSQAVIKFQSISEIPFSQLELELDLRLPPANWLNGAIKLSSYKSTFNFSSFKMAFDFYDELFSDEIDVIASSEVIKKLLMLAYNDQSMLSYFVHRVGNTLLIDEFNLHRYLLWKSEDDDWKWLRKFLCEQVLNSLKEKSPIPIEHKKTKEFLDRKNLLSKFLYYSIEDSKKVQEEKEHEPSYRNNNNVILPQPSVKDMENICEDNHQYSRTIVWDFEDIRMMIGSDMQIFGNDTRPCISLRLRDMKEKINVLTGIDYWLDNLMCNVPEIFMCYHLDGIVQKYELIKTEELPNLNDSKFKPKVIRNVAQNILSFLKQNATKPGHTYWLFKSRNDDVVKLYDLTTLQLLSEEKESSEGKEEKKDSNTNPFTYPVGVLLYTLARNMKYSKEKFTAKTAGNIKLLLENCLKLLPIEKYPQIITTSHYILSDIQIPAGLDPINPKPNFETGDESSDENSDEQEESEDEVDESSFPVVQSIKETLNEYKPVNRKSNGAPPLILGSIQERSEESLKNVVAGLEAIEYLESDANLAREKQKEKDQIIHEEQNPNLLQNPDIAIPMGWINNNHDTADDASSVSNKSFHNVDAKSLLMKGNPNVKTWNIHLRTLLFEKASLTYACLAEDSYNSKDYGAALKNIRQSITCQAVIKKYIPSITTQQSVLYGRAGDCYFQISKSLDQIQKLINGFNNESEIDREILKQLEKEGLGEIETEILMPMDDEEKMLESSSHCYEKSLLDTNQSQIELIRRLANVYNEIGVKLMHRSQNSYNAFIADFNSKSDNEKPSSNTSTYQQIAKQSYDYLMKAVTLFESANDHINLVICFLNLGRFYRLSAHINVFQNYQVSKSMHMQKKYYQQSFDSYRKALDILVERKMKSIELYDIVLWEYSTSVFNLAKEMQEGMSADNLREEAEREVLEMLMKALQLCDHIESNNSRQVLYMFRAALIHQRIASLHHQCIRVSVEEQKRKQILQLCRLHYEKSIKLLETLKEFKDFFKVQLERIALQEFLAEESTNVQIKSKNYHLALSFFLESASLLKSLSLKKSVIEADEILSLLELFEKRLQFVLKSLIKLSTSSKKSNEVERFKKMFAATLRNTQKLKLEDLTQHLLHVLDTINNQMESK